LNKKKEEVRITTRIPIEVYRRLHEVRVRKMLEIGCDISINTMIIYLLETAMDVLSKDTSNRDDTIDVK
jgi:hypothetical protein